MEAHIQSENYEDALEKFFLAREFLKSGEIVSESFQNRAEKALLNFFNPMLLSAMAHVLLRECPILTDKIILFLSQEKEIILPMVLNIASEKLPVKEVKFKSAAVKLLPYYKKDALEEIRKNDLAKSPYPETQKLILDIVERFGDETYIDFVLTITKHGSKSSKIAAIEVLAKMGGINVIDNIIELAEDHNETVSLAAIKKLGDMGGEKALSFLKSKTENKQALSESIEMGRCLIEALGKIDVSESVKIIDDILSNSSFLHRKAFEEIDLCCIRTLGNMKNNTAHEVLKIYTKKGSKNIREASTKELSRIKKI